MSTASLSVNDTMINFRTNSKIKNKANKILEDMGLDMSTAFNMVLRSIVNFKGMRINNLTVNGFTPEYEAMLLRSEKEALASKKSYKSAAEMWESIDKKTRGKI